MAEGGKWQMVAWGVAAVLVVVAGARLLGRHDPAPRPVRIDGGARQESATGAADAEAKGGLYVHVAGAVRRPGLLRVSSGARVAAAIARAGGPARGADLTAVNLAQPLEDGQQVIVPRRGAPAGSVASSAGGSVASQESVGTPAGAATPSLATATLEQLDGLDGIGPTLAKRIVEYRESHGGFRSIEELREVDGIGEKRFAALRKVLRP